jgi:hypothetical protein
MMMKFNAKFKELIEATEISQRTANLFIKKLYRDIKRGVERIQQIHNTEIRGEIRISTLRKMAEEMFDKEVDYPDGIEFEVKHEDEIFDFSIWTDYKTITAHALSRAKYGESGYNNQHEDVQGWDLVRVLPSEEAHLDDARVNVINKYISNKGDVQ